MEKVSNLAYKSKGSWSTAKSLLCVPVPKPPDGSDLRPCNAEVLEVNLSSADVTWTDLAAAEILCRDVGLCRPILMHRVLADLSQLRGQDLEFYSLQRPVGFGALPRDTRGI